LADGVPCDEGRGWIDAVPERGQRGDRRRQQRRLRPSRLIQPFRGTFPGEIANGPSEHGGRHLADRPRGRHPVRQVASHANGLRTLGEEEEGDGHSVASISISSWPYSTASPVSVTRLRTVPRRGAPTLLLAAAGTAQCRVCPLASSPAG